MLRKAFLNEKFILVIILLNAAVIFFQGFKPHYPFSFWLDIFDNIFTLIFVIEAFVKIRYWGRQKYFNSYWNIFDLSLVLLALPSFITWVFGINIISLDFLLIFRILRVFKFFRFIRFVPKVEHLIAGVTRAAKASVLIILAFFIFNFTVALVSCFLFRDISPEYFRDPIISLYSIFKVFTIEGWYEIPDSIAVNASAMVASFTRLYFVIILFFGGIFGLSLVNSIFVDTMVSDNNDSLEKKISELEKKIDKLIENK
jgi:voltage-gated sodium channel